MFFLVQATLFIIKLTFFSFGSVSGMISLVLRRVSRLCFSFWQGGLWVLLFGCLLYPALSSGQTNFIHLKSFGEKEPYFPFTSLAQDKAGFLYGFALNDGDESGSALFKVRTNGAGFSILHRFTTLYPWNPRTLLHLDGVLYGSITGMNGSEKEIFRIYTDGSGYQV